jgi:hypothetical protein
VEGPLDLALEVAALLDRLNIPYVLGGSFASSLVGEPRATADVDMAVVLRVEDADALIRELGPEFYVSREAALEAINRSSSFNLVHLPSVQKVDLFVLGESLLDRRQLERRRRVRVVESPPAELWVGSSEDQVLRKLTWYEAGAGVSDRQWRDVLGVLAVQAERLDRDYLERTAAELGLSELLSRALNEAGLVE